MKKTLLSLFDFSGTWSEPYALAGWDVYRVDIKNGDDVFDVMDRVIKASIDGGFRVNGLLAAPPCTDFSSSGAQYWGAKKSQPAQYMNEWTGLKFDSTTELSTGLVLATLFIIELTQPDFWAIENPVGRLNTLVPELVPFGPRYFQPHQYGDPYTKKTGLWGTFNMPKITQPALNLFGTSEIMKYGGKSAKTKEMRSITPKGFAQAFYNFNH